MFIAISTISILTITCLLWLLNRILPFKICPICAGVAVTWLWILTGIYFSLLDAEGWKLIAAIAMGGSVVGVAYQIEKRLPPNRSLLLWKTFFITAGFAAVYSLISFWWAGLIVAATLLAVFILKFLAEPQGRAAKNKRVEELENKMKDCC